ncbi:MAG: hypothetical protein R3244_05060 [Thermoanaerobaculia bacterium]|nr:hypothetical protein [Thermoanaerobaculia bacterium]
MFESVRQSLALPRLRVDMLLAAATVSSFAWLLIHDLLHPFAVYLLQLYLSF